MADLVRATQVFAEVLVDGPSAKARMTQMFAEVLRSREPDNVRLTQIFAEILTDGVPLANEPPVIPPGTLVWVAGTWLIFEPHGGVLFFPAAYNLEFCSLNSEIEVGPFRFAEQLQSDETSLISSLILGLHPAASEVLNEDWMEEFGDEDWNDGAAVEFEDWGEDVGNPDLFTLRLAASDDGINPGKFGEELLEVFDDLGSSYQYGPAGYSGIFHRMRLTAVEVNEGFTLKFIDISGSLTGRKL